MLCGLEEDRMGVVYVVCFIEFVVCCLNFVGDGCEEAYWVRYVPLVDGIFSFDWYSALEGGWKKLCDTGTRWKYWWLEVQVCIK